MTIPEYNEIQDMDDRLNAVIENITTFKDKVNDPEIESQIRKDIEFNYNHYLSRVEIEKSKIQYLFDLPQTEHHSQFTLNSFVFYFFPENTNGFVRI
jgi:hypothetical protein